MTSENNGMVMPVAPYYGGGYGGNDMFGGNSAWWLLILLIALGGWGNGFGGIGGGNGGMYPWLVNGQMQGYNDVQRGFDQNAVITGITGVHDAVTTGFGNVQTALCNGFAGVNAGIANGFAQAEIANNARQMADMNQNFAMQSALQNCCCENRAGIADLKYTVASEECATRTNSTQNTQGILNAINGGIQSIKDQLCQDKIDTKNETIAQLRQELAMKDLAASQTAQNAFIQQGFSKEVDDLYTRLSNCPVPSTPVFGRTPIFTCGGNNVGCGCGCGGNTFMN